MTAQQCREPAAAPTTETPDTLCRAGFGHLRGGRLLEAQACCERALAIDQGHADTLHLMALVSLGRGQPDHAVAWTAQAIRQVPKVEYLVTLGTVLRQQSRREEALQAFDKAVQLRPGEASLWRQLGEVLLDLGRADDALLALQHALSLDAGDFDAGFGCGVLLYQRQRVEEALSHFARCAASRPDSAQALAMLTRCLFDLRRFDEALAENRRALAHDPDNVDVCNNIGVALQSLGRDDEAQPWFDRALAARPDSVAVLGNKAASLLRMGRFDDAAAVYARVRTIDPEDAAAAWELAHLDLLHGRFDAGWAGREARWRVAQHRSTYPQFVQPQWRGEGVVEGRSILVHVDEGMGDSIQFARYLPLLAARGARVFVVDQQALSPLLSRLPGVAAFVALGAGALPPFDLHCPMTSLPLAFKTRLDTIPPASYLAAPEADRVRAWEKRLGPRHHPRVGLVWSGNPRHKNDHNRSIALPLLAPLLDLDVQFVSLQKSPPPGDQAMLERAGVVDLTTRLIDFGETAALLACLDLVITVDTSVVHLAGSLGRPTWVLLPHAPDWRWLLDRDDSPWYPTVRLFRQDAARDYARVIEQVRTELAAWCRSPSGRSP